MSKKHYTKIAEAMRSIKPPVASFNDSLSDQYQVWYKAVMSLAIVCKEDNPRFNPDQFIQACGYNYI